MSAAEATLAEMRRLQAQRHELYRTALGAYEALQAGSAGRDRGRHSQHRLQPPQPPEPLLSAHAYGALVDGYMRMGAAAAAEAAASRMQSEAGLPPNRVVYNTLLRGYCKLGVAGQARALELLGEMRAAGVRPGPDTYTTLLAAAAEMPGSQQLADVFQEVEAGAFQDGGQCSASVSDAEQGGTEWPPVVQRQADQLRARVRTQQGQQQPQQPWLTSPPSGAVLVAGGTVHFNGMALNGTARPPAPSSSSSTAAPASGLAAKPTPRRQEAGHPDSKLGQLRGPVHVPDSTPAAAPSTIPSHTAGSGARLHAAQGSSSYSTVEPGERASKQPSLAAIAGDAAALLSSLHAGGLVADGALLTALMMLHARAGRHELAMRVFQELSGSQDACVDVAAWNALAAVHVARGAMGDAEEAVSQAAAMAASQGKGPPEEAFTAVVQGYTTAGDMGRMLAQYKRFLVLGGRPPRRMLDTVVDACLRRGEMALAMKALRAAELTGARVSRERYQAWFRRWETWHARRGGSRDGSVSGDEQDMRGVQADDVGRGFERFKWWLGLPNNYYSQEWREQGGGSGGRNNAQSR